MSYRICWAQSVVLAKLNRSEPNAIGSSSKLVDVYPWRTGSCHQFLKTCRSAGWLHDFCIHIRPQIFHRTG